MFLEGLRPDVIAVVAFGQILPAAVFKHTAPGLYKCARLAAAGIQGRRPHAEGRYGRKGAHRRYHHEDERRP